MNNKNKTIRLSKNVLRQIIAESLCEIERNKKIGDIIPDVGRTQDSNAFHWNCIYNLMSNVQKAMEYTQRDKKRVSANDVQSIIQYINMSLQNIMKPKVGSNNI